MSFGEKDTEVVRMPRLRGQPLVDSAEAPPGMQGKPQDWMPGVGQRAQWCGG
jgi:hypothetical protein